MLKTTERILVDTHIWLWYLNGDNTLSSRVQKMLNGCATKNGLYLSAISVWEIAMLANKKKIVLNTSCQVWVSKSLSLPGVSLVPLSPEIAVESCELPNNFHGDPADRIIVATAKVENLCIVSRDKKLTTYCSEQGINLIQA